MSVFFCYSLFFITKECFIDSINEIRGMESSHNEKGPELHQQRVVWALDVCVFLFFLHFFYKTN